MSKSKICMQASEKKIFEKLSPPSQRMQGQVCKFRGGYTSSQLQRNLHIRPTFPRNIQLSQLFDSFCKILAIGSKTKASNYRKFDRWYNSPVMLLEINRLHANIQHQVLIGYIM